MRTQLSTFVGPRPQTIIAQLARAALPVALATILTARPAKAPSGTPPARRSFYVRGARRRQGTTVVPRSPPAAAPDAAACVSGTHVVTHAFRFRRRHCPASSAELANKAVGVCLVQNGKAEKEMKKRKKRKRSQRAAVVSAACFLVSSIQWKERLPGGIAGIPRSVFGQEEHKVRIKVSNQPFLTLFEVEVKGRTCMY